MSGGRRIPVIGDTYVDREFGTGALKITPGHDPNDYEIGKRVGLPIINIMNKVSALFNVTLASLPSATPPHHREQRHARTVRASQRERHQGD